MAPRGSPSRQDPVQTEGKGGPTLERDLFGDPQVQFFLAVFQKNLDLKPCKELDNAAICLHRKFY